MKVLVTGAAGRIGARLIDSLLADGRAVVGLDIRETVRPDAHYRGCKGDLRDPALARTAVDEAEAVFHLGALMSWAPKDAPAMFDANVAATRVLLDAAAEAGVKRFIFASSGEVYPENAPLELPITESHPLRPNSPYGMTKLLGEELVRYYRRASAMETVILRFAHTQDAGELLDEESFFSGPRFFLHPRIRQQEALGNAANVALLRERDPGEPAHVLAQNEDGRPYMMHITDTRDIVTGLVLALDHGDAAGKTFNLGATDPVDLAHLLEKMSKITGYPLIPINFPGKGVHYRTSNELIRNTLAYAPKWTIDEMLEEAAQARNPR